MQASVKQLATLAVPVRWRLPVVGLGYFAFAAVSLSFTRFDGGVAFIWIANAFLISWLCLTPSAEHGKTVVVCLFATIVATMTFGGRVPALPLAVIALIEVVVTVRLLRRFVYPLRNLDGVKVLGLFALIAGVLVPALAAVAAGVVTSVFMDRPFVANVIDWFAAHALGAFAFSPAMTLMLARRSRAAVRYAGRAEAIALLVLVAATAVIVFAQSRLPLLFLPLVPMMVATLRIERAGASLSIVLLAVVGIALTLAGRGPVKMIDAHPGFHIQFLQFYIAAAAGLLMPVAALLHQRGQLLTDLSASEAAYRLLTESSGDAMFNLGLDGTIRYASRAVFALGGFDPRDLIGTNARDLVLPEDKPLVVAAHMGAIGEPGRTFAVEYRCRTADGRMLWFETRTRAIVDEQGRATGAVSAIREISDRKAAESELARAATTDALTGLLNRRGFMAMLERHVDPGPRGSAVVMVDLDHFKTVNDRWGHAVGDLVLCAFADVVRRMLRGSDTVGRIGGEEFALLLRDIDTERAMALCERLRAALEAASVAAADGTRVRITASFGIAALGGACIGAEALKAADKALYQAKESGRNRLRLAA